MTVIVFALRIERLQRTACQRQRRRNQKSREMAVCLGRSIPDLGKLRLHDLVASLASRIGELSTEQPQDGQLVDVEDAPPQEASGKSYPTFGVQ